MIETGQKFFNLCKENISLTQLVIALSIMSLAVLLRNLFTQKAIRVLDKSTENISGERAPIQREILISLTQPLGLAFVLLGLYISGNILALPEPFSSFFKNVCNTFASLHFFWVLYRLITPFALLSEKNEGRAEIKGFIATLLKALVVIIGFLSLLQGWGVNVGAFLAGLGLAGMAVALAAQDTMKNFFGSLALLMDGTFHKGETIKTSSLEGVIEHIGLRTTTIRQADKALVKIPNAKLADTAVTNFARVTNRLVLWNIGVSPMATVEQLKNISQRIRDYLEKNNEIETDPKKVTTLIHFDQFTDYSINLFCHFFTKTTNWAHYMSIKEECLLNFKKIIEDEGVELAICLHDTKNHASNTS
jgi:MscS family membrane protein